MEKAAHLGGEPEVKAALAGCLCARQALCSSPLEEGSMMLQQVERSDPLQPLWTCTQGWSSMFPPYVKWETPTAFPYLEEFLPKSPLYTIHIYVCTYMYKIGYWSKRRKILWKSAGFSRERDAKYVSNKAFLMIPINKELKCWPCCPLQYHSSRYV